MQLQLESLSSQLTSLQDNIQEQDLTQLASYDIIRNVYVKNNLPDPVTATFTFESGATQTKTIKPGK